MKKTRKRLVICSDGTWNTADQQKNGKLCPTNVVKLSRFILPEAPDGTPQIVFYDEGVGTGWSVAERFTGGAFGRGLSKNIEDAYRFLMNNYEEGDDVFFFGFSRGAFTVRSTIGLIRNCGLLHKAHADQFRKAFDIYRSDDPKNDPGAEYPEEFIHTYGRKIHIHMLGVWDTVGALGIPNLGLNWWMRKRYEFHDVQLSRIVRSACQALAIDEWRRPYRPAIWKRLVGSHQKIEQMWFAGAHCDIGGGYAESGLSDIALKWMIEKAEEAGLVCDPLQVSGLRPDPLAPAHNEYRGFWRLMGRHLRPVQEPVAPPYETCEEVHLSVLERMARTTYAPENLKRALVSA